MSLSSDNFTALIHLRDQARKWKNITFLTAIIVFIIMVKLVFSNPASTNNLDEDGDYIASIDIDGIIFSNKHRSKVLREIKEKENIKAVIVNINSPGGGIVGSEILYREILDISKEKPVVVLMDAIATSGGYMAAIGSDYIIAHNGTLTGSIGVIMQSTEVTELADKVGVKFQNYKSSHLKGTPSPFEKTSPLVDGVINESVANSHKYFIELVMSRRKDKISKKDVKKIFDGRIFTGRQALDVGLIDQIGTRQEAIDYLKTAHKVKDLKVKDVSLKKLETKLIERILNKETVGRFFNSSVGGKELMAIW